jgi:hypothetical protein
LPALLSVWLRQWWANRRRIRKELFDAVFIFAECEKDEIENEKRSKESYGREKVQRIHFSFFRHCPEKWWGMNGDNATVFK